MISSLRRFRTFRALPGKEAEVASLIRGLQEKVRREPGNLVFQATTRQGDPAAFHVCVAPCLLAVPLPCPAVPRRHRSR